MFNSYVRVITIWYIIDSLHPNKNPVKSYSTHIQPPFNLHETPLNLNETSMKPP